MGGCLGFWFPDYPGHMTRKRRWCGLPSPQGPLPHEANMQSHSPNLRCKNSSLSRDAHGQKNRLLHKESFYVEGPWSIVLDFSGPSFCRPQGHCMVIDIWMVRAHKQMEIIWTECSQGRLRLENLVECGCWTGIGFRHYNGCSEYVDGSTVWKWEKIGEAVDLSLFWKRMWVRNVILTGPRLCNMYVIMYFCVHVHVCCCVCMCSMRASVWMPLKLYIRAHILTFL